ncbi:Paired box protein Pax-6 [Armadillidium vulgare]|nr:Paired box protein Pax-6 [Armadillidium vulgare]
MNNFDGLGSNCEKTAVRENFIEATNQKKFRENKKPAFKRKVNKTFTSEQMEELEKEFLDNESIDKRRRKELSMKLKTCKEKEGVSYAESRRSFNYKLRLYRYLSSLQHGSNGSERPANSLEENNLTKTTIEYDKLQQQHDVGVGENFIEATNHKKFSEYKKPAFKRKVKKNFTWEQIEELEKEFLKNKFIGIQRRKELSMKLKASEKRILVWFRNRRAKRKRELAMRNRKHLSIENKNYHSPLHHGSNSSERPCKFVRRK